MDYFAHAKDAYIEELARRDEIRRALHIPTGLGVVIGGAIFSLVTSYPWSEFSWNFNTLFGMSALLATVSLSVAVFFLARTYVSYEYALAPTAKEILDYRSDLNAYYEHSNTDEGSVDREIKIYLTQQYAADAHHNALNNYAKSARLYKANIAFVVSVIMVGVMSSSYVFSSLGSDYERYRQRQESGQTQEASEARAPAQ